MGASSFEIYRSQDGSIELNVTLENETVWLNRQQMADLFQRDIKTIGKHISNALKEELNGMPVVVKFATPKKYGRVHGYSQKQYVEYYNLEMITSVGFRVKSKQGVLFRRWANTILREYIIKGFVVNENIKLERYNELKDVVRLMTRTESLHNLVSNDEYSGLFNVIRDYVYVYNPDGKKRIADNTLVALTLMIAESRTEEMDVIVKVVVSLINRENH